MTKKCKNPQCNKDIPDTMMYCSEDCLKRHIESKEKSRNKPVQLIKYTEDGIAEVREICETFGFVNTEGKVVGEHNATVLSFLRQYKEGVYKTMVDKLTWLCHTSNRNLKENYLSGIEAFGIIETFTNEFGVLKWRWIGMKALRNNGSEKEC